MPVRAGTAVVRSPGIVLRTWTGARMRNAHDAARVPSGAPSAKRYWVPGASPPRGMIVTVRGSGPAATARSASGFTWRRAAIAAAGSPVRLVSVSRASGATPASSLAPASSVATGARGASTTLCQVASGLSAGEAGGLAPDAGGATDGEATANGEAAGVDRGGGATSSHAAVTPTTAIATATARSGAVGRQERSLPAIVVVSLDRGPTVGGPPQVQGRPSSAQ
jgi:hypothetical protein